MKKIYVNKTDSAASVIERVTGLDDKEVTLYIPRDTEFSKLKNNFRLLKREAGDAGKEVIIESVEEVTLDSAAAVGIKAVNPFFGQKTRMVSDIVMKTEVDGPAAQAKRQAVQQPEKQQKKEQAKAETIFTARELGEDGGSAWADEDEHPRSWKMTFMLLLSAVLLIGIGAALYVILPEATITLTFNESPLPYTGPLIINSNVQTSSATTTQITIPGTIFSDTENNVVTFSPSDSKQVSLNASGPILIYNDYSSSPQVLVKTTRFTSPDGKVYRLASNITVPGATMSGGQLVPASVQATITADQPGAAYNFSTTTRFRIPGFQSTSKYDGFYADSAGPFTGGFVGVMKVPTAADVAAARATAEDGLNGTLLYKLMAKLPSGFKEVASSSQVSITSENISSTPDSQGQYSITVYGSIKIFAFRESDLLSVLATELVSQSNSALLTLHDYSVQYTDAQPNFTNGTMAVSLNLASNWVQTFDVGTFQNRAEGLDNSALKTLIFSLPGIKTADIKFWPFWVRTVPQNTSKIHVDVAYAS